MGVITPRVPVIWVRAAPSNRYLVDASGAPFFMVGDGTAQGMIAMISVATAQQYLAIRKAQGFNAIWTDVLWDPAEGGNAGSATFDGINPFTTTVDGTNYDLTAPNPAYFTRVDQMIAATQQYGMTVLFNVMDSGNWLGVLQANGLARCNTYGQYVAARYHTTPNIIFMVGNDTQTWRTVSDSQLSAAILQGIGQVDGNVHLLTTELDYLISGSMDDPQWVPYTSMAGAYSYYPSYWDVLRQYNAARTTPVYLEESYYEGVSSGILTPNSASNIMYRKIAYWTMLSGGLAGYIHGTQYFNFTAGWQAGIQSTPALHIGTYWKNLFVGLPGWWTLVPDQTQSVCTAGYGTATGSLNTAGPPNSTGNGRIDTDNYVTTAYDPKGSLLVAYLPVNTTITIAMTIMRGTMVARWYDPTTGIFSTIGGYANTGTQTFTSSNNTAGDPDQVLVLTA